MKKNRGSVLLGAAFIMATSAIGPGFLTQTAVFTEKLKASFGFAILVSVLVDLVAQINIWLIIGAANKRAQDLCNALLPGLGSFLSILIIAGGIVFNIGNIAGCGLGFQVMFGMDVQSGAMLSAGIAILIFMIREAGILMDWFAKILGFLMIGLMLFVCISAAPPLTEALQKTLLPDTLDFVSIVTIVGGTVGGYITFAGAHRLMDAGISGKENLSEIRKSAITAISLASIMRILLFLAALGVVSQGLSLDPKNPAASVFQLATGETGFRLFGVVIWAAAVTSVVGGSFTSVSFALSFHPLIAQKKNYFIIGMILLATFLFLIFDRPVKVLLFAGAFNGLILAFSLGIMLMASSSKKLMGDYRHPTWLWIAGIIVVLLMLIFGSLTMVQEVGKLF